MFLDLTGLESDSYVKDSDSSLTLPLLDSNLYSTKGGLEPNTTKCMCEAQRPEEINKETMAAYHEDDTKLHERKKRQQQKSEWKSNYHCGTDGPIMARKNKAKLAGSAFSSERFYQSTKHSEEACTGVWR